MPGLSFEKKDCVAEEELGIFDIEVGDGVCGV